MQTSQQPTKTKFIRRASARQRLIAAVVLLAIVGSYSLLRLAATGKFDIARVLGPCGFKQKYHLPCPTCGMTTATLAFVRGNIPDSFYIQPAAAIICSLLVVAAFFAFIIAVFRVYCTFFESFFTKIKVRYLILGLVVIIGAGWAVTLTRALISG